MGNASFLRFVGKVQSIKMESDSQSEFEFKKVMKFYKQHFSMIWTPHTPMHTHTHTCDAFKALCHPILYYHFPFINISYEDPLMLFSSHFFLLNKVILNIMFGLFSLLFLLCSRLLSNMSLSNNRCDWK